MSKPSKFAAWKKAATRDEASVQVCLDRRLFREFTDLQRQLEESRQVGMLDQPGEVRDLAEQVVKLKEQIDKDRAEHTFVFATVPYSQWRELVEEHGPTEQQKADNRYAEFNPDTFPQAAIAAASVDPELTVEDAEWLREQLPRGEFDRLLDAVFTVNVGGSQLPKSVSGTVDQLASVLSSTTPQPEDSPSPSSEDG